MKRVYTEDSGIAKEVYYVIGLLTIPLLFFFIYGIYQQIILGQPFGKSPMSDNGLIIFTLLITIFEFVMVWGLTSMRLSIRVADGVLSFRFPPFVFKTRSYHLRDFEIWEFRKRSPFITGIGLRHDLSTGSTIYSPGSNYVFYFKLKKGKSVMLGTRNPEELKAAIESNKSRDYE